MATILFFLLLILKWSLKEDFVIILRLQRYNYRKRFKTKRDKVLSYITEIDKMMTIKIMSIIVNFIHITLHY